MAVGGYNGVNWNQLLNMERASGNDGNFLNAFGVTNPQDQERLIREGGGLQQTGLRVEQTGTQQAQATAKSPPAKSYSQGRVNSASAKHFTRVDARAHIVDSNGNERSGENLDKTLRAGLDSSNPRRVQATQSYMQRNGLDFDAEGKLVVANNRLDTNSAGAALAFGGRVGGRGIPASRGGGGGGGGGPTSTSAGLSGSDNISGAGWGALAAGAVALPIGIELFTSGGMGLVSAAGTAASVPGMAHMGAYGVAATAAAAAGQDGLSFRLRQQMRAIAEDYRDNNMLSMINNQAMPIEDLIFLFMAYMSDKYEDKLRAKMEEALIQEKVERRIERRNQEAQFKANMAGAIGGMFGPVGGMVGQVVGQAEVMRAQKTNDLDAALNGSGKSSTMLMQEIGMLVNKWKMLAELCSNLIKALHDMAMVPVRNIR